ncbi:MAG: sulfatase [Planctomycetota bacterium]
MKLSRSMLGLISCLILGGCAQIPLKSESSPPSVILVLADDLGWADISCQGSAWATPAIDQLAAEGVRLTRAYSNGPNCAPSRACLMTGLDVAEHGVFTVAPAARGKKENRKLVPPKTRRTLEDDEITIAEMLKDSGYRSAHIGKWHLGDDPRSQGFDVSIAGDRRGHPKTHLAPWKLPHLPEQEDGTELADALTDHAIDFIRECGDQPYLLVLSHYAVHTPVQVSEAALKRWQKIWPEGTRRQQKYAALVESVDRSVSRLMDEVRAGGEGRETVIIFTSDNGGLEGFTDNGPLRGGKGMLYEGGIRVPMIAWGERIPGGRVNTQNPVQLTDLVPTLLEWSGTRAPESLPLAGTSLVSLLEDGTPLPERDLYWHFPAYLSGAARRHGIWRTTPVSAIMRGDDKLLEFFESGERQLYDLSDVSEERNLSEERPEQALNLHQRLIRWREERKMPMPTAP